MFHYYKGKTIFALFIEVKTETIRLTYINKKYHQIVNTIFTETITKLKKFLIPKDFSN